MAKLSKTEKLLNDFRTELETFFSEAEKGLDGNAAAARRSRTSSMKLRNILKEYKAESVKG